MRKEDACGSDRSCESPLKTGQHRNINNAQYTKGAGNPENSMRQLLFRKQLTLASSNKTVLFERVLRMPQSPFL